MHLRRKRGLAPWFPYEEFRAQRRDVRTEWKTAEDLQTAAGGCPDGAKVLFCLPEGTIWVGQLRL